MTNHNRESEIVDRLGTEDILEITGSQGIARFEDFKDEVDISGPTLASRLDEMQKAGLLERSYYDEMPPQVEYTLTSKGEDLYQD